MEGEVEREGVKRQRERNGARFPLGRETGGRDQGAEIKKTYQDLELHLTVVLVLILVEIGEVSLDDATLQVLGSHAHAGAAGDESLANITDLQQEMSISSSTAHTSNLKTASKRLQNFDDIPRRPKEP